MWRWLLWVKCNGEWTYLGDHPVDNHDAHQMMCRAILYGDLEYHQELYWVGE